MDALLSKLLPMETNRERAWSMRFGSCYLDLATKCFDLVDVGFASPERWRELEDEKKETAAFVPAGLLRLLRWLAQRDESGITAEEAAAWAARIPKQVRPPPPGEALPQEGVDTQPAKPVAAQP